MDGRLQLRQTIPDSIDVRMTYGRCVQRSAAQLTESLESWCEGADHYRHELYVTPGKEMRDERCILYRIPSAQCTVSSAVGHTATLSACCQHVISTPITERHSSAAAAVRRYGAMH